MQRPLTGEPLAVDLVNTTWRRRDGECDALATTAGLAAWLHERGLGEVHQNEQVRRALVRTRTVLRAVLENEPGAEEALNAILARGTVVRSLRDGAVRQHVMVRDPAWTLAWESADDYLRLRDSGARRIRRCEQQSCVLYFYDPTGRRRWCSMAGCGNRVKAQRHYARQRSLRAGPE
jgi:predicted RNA-binding Zn ribbon-like protein